MNDLDLLKKLHTQTIQSLLDRISKGEATAAELTAAINMLKHNGINASPAADPNLGKLKGIVETAFGGEDDLTVQ